jgi:hypothetical protein
MKWHCKECGCFSLKLNKEEECSECARKDETLRATGAGELILPPVAGQ